MVLPSRSSLNDAPRGQVVNGQTNVRDWYASATGRSVSVLWANVFRFDSDGRIIAASAYYDQLTILIQLGHIDAPTAT